MSPPSYVALLRHGEADRLNAVEVEDSLTERGRRQAEAAAAYVAPLGVEWVRTSPRPRARATAELVRQALGPEVPIELVTDLTGLGLKNPNGDFPLRSVEEFSAAFAEPDKSTQGGESLAELVARMRPSVLAALDAPGNGVLVSHRMSNSAVLADLLGASLPAGDLLLQDPGAVNVIQRRESGYVVISINVMPDDPLLTGAAGGTLPDLPVPVERRLYLVRHGENVDFLAGRSGGAGGAGLTERGRRQAERLGELFAAVDTPSVVASPFARADETARILARGREVRPEPDATELHLGDYDGRSMQDIFEVCPGFLIDADARPPGGESGRECGERGARAVQRALDEIPSRDVIVVAHGGLLRMGAAHMLGLPVEVGMPMRSDWAGVTILDYAAGRWWLRCLNWTPEGVAELEHAAPIAGLTEDQARLVGR